MLLGMERTNVRFVYRVDFAKVDNVTENPRFDKRIITGDVGGGYKTNTKSKNPKSLQGGR